MWTPVMWLYSATLSKCLRPKIYEANTKTFWEAPGGQVVSHKKSKINKKQ